LVNIKVGRHLLEPAALTDVTTDMLIAKEETFGPVAPLYRFTNDAEVIPIGQDIHPFPPALAGREGRGRRRLL
jgi:acyl-CoA reductase-like NAD-dependent aldehyde dehydrogenase